MNRLSKVAGVWFLVTLFLLATLVPADRVRAGEGGSAETRDYAASRQIAYLESNRPGPVEMIIDGIIVRPITLAATIVGSAFFILTLPFSAPSGSVDEAAETMVAGPAAYTFTRCLGCWPRRSRVEPEE